MAGLGDNPDGVQFLIVQSVFTWLALVAVGLRLWARRLTEANIDSSDYTCLIALVFVLGQAGTGIASVVLGGVGLHSVVLSSPQLTIAHQTLFAGDVCWIIANCFVKLSILRFLNAIFRRKPWFSRIVGPLSVLVMLACVGCVIGRFLQCRPLAFVWDPSIRGGSCATSMPMSVATAIISLVFDVTIFILPIPVILGLQMRPSRKVAIVAVFGLGAVICIISGLRIAAIFTIDISDFTSSIVSYSEWSILDNTLGIVSACLPLLPPIINHTTGRDYFAWTRRPSQQMSPMHSPTGSLYHDTMVSPPRAHRRPSRDMASLAWGGSNRTPGLPSGDKGGSIWAAHPVSPSSHRNSSRPNGYRGLGGRQERARGPPLAFNPNYFYPPAMRRNMSHHGSVSSVHSPSFLSSLTPSRSHSQRQNSDQRRSSSRHGGRESRHGGRESRLGGRESRLDGSRVASRLGSRRGSRSNSRMGRRSEIDEDDALDLTAYTGHEEVDSKTHVAIVSHGRAPSPDDNSDSAHGSNKGITVTTTWDVDVESLKSAPEDEDDEMQYDYDGEYQYHSRSGSFHGHARPELLEYDYHNPGDSRSYHVDK